MRSAADLPDDIDELKRRLIAAEAGLLAKTLEAEKLKFELARLRRMAFGQSSERIEREIAQLELKLEEIETTAAVAGLPEFSEPAPAPTASSERKPRRKLPEHLPRREERHEPVICICARCGFERLRHHRGAGVRTRPLRGGAPCAAGLLVRQVRGHDTGADAGDADPARDGRC
jgi:transposase IS166 family protein